jgi:hypothetical protein
VHIAIRPSYLNTSPPHATVWLSRSFLNELRIFCERRGFGFYGVWIREPFHAAHPEDIELLLHVPDHERAALEEFLRAASQGSEQVLHMGSPYVPRAHYKNRVNIGISYLPKKMRPEASFRLDEGLRPQMCNKITSENEVPVLRKRCGMSKTLDYSARAKFWAARGGRPVKTARPTAPIGRAGLSSGR